MFIKTEQRSGSGFIFRADGYILTNEHVVTGATEVSVTVEGRSFPATIVGTDGTSDIAVLKIDTTTLHVARMDTTNRPRRLQRALAVGFPAGAMVDVRDPSVTEGIISGEGRSLAMSPTRIAFDMLQTSAAVNPGNSGGPLVNDAGDVIGVVTANYSLNNGGSDGVGFAIPIGRAVRLAQELIEYGHIRPVWIGAEMTPVLPASISEAQGSPAIVRCIVPQSPAAKAGIHVGDEIRRLGNRDVHSVVDWATRVLDLRPGDGLALEIERAGKLEHVTFTVSAQPASGAGFLVFQSEVELVVATDSVPSPVASSLPLAYRDLSSVLTVKRATECASAMFGVQAGDEILAIGTANTTGQSDFRPTQSARDLYEYIAMNAPGTPLVLVLKRSEDITSSPRFFAR